MAAALFHPPLVSQPQPAVRRHIYAARPAPVAQPKRWSPSRLARRGRAAHASAGSGGNGLPASDHDFVAATVDSVGTTSAGEPIIFLRIADAADGRGELILPVYVGAFESSSLAQALNKVKSPRPQTYDLFAAALAAGSLTVAKVVVTHMADNTFHARLFLAGPTTEPPPPPGVTQATGAVPGTPPTTARLLVDVDARPSDAINLAARAGAPIYIARTVVAHSAHARQTAQPPAVHGAAHRHLASGAIPRESDGSPRRRGDPTMELRARLAVAVREDRTADVESLSAQLGAAAGDGRAGGLLVALERAIVAEDWAAAAACRDALSAVSDALELARAREDHQAEAVRRGGGDME